MVETPELHQVVIILMYACVRLYSCLFIIMLSHHTLTMLYMTVFRRCLMYITEAFKPKDSVNGTHCIL